MPSCFLGEPFIVYLGSCLNFEPWVINYVSLVKLVRTRCPKQMLNTNHLIEMNLVSSIVQFEVLH